MDFVARSYSRAKWEVKDYMKSNKEIAADAVTVCLRTHDNKLSLWRFNEKNHKIEEVVLAIASNPNRKNLEKMHLIIIPRNEIEKEGFMVKSSPGDTPVECLRDRHLDIIELNLKKLSKFAKVMCKRVRIEEGCYLFTRKHVLEIIKTAIQNNLLSIDILPEKVKDEIRQVLI